MNLEEEHAALLAEYDGLNFGNNRRALSSESESKSESQEDLESEGSSGIVEKGSEFLGGHPKWKRRLGALRKWRALGSLEGSIEPQNSHVRRRTFQGIFPEAGGVKYSLESFLARAEKVGYGRLEKEVAEMARVTMNRLNVSDSRAKYRYKSFKNSSATFFKTFYEGIKTWQKVLPPLDSSASRQLETIEERLQARGNDDDGACVDTIQDSTMCKYTYRCDCATENCASVIKGSGTVPELPVADVCQKTCGTCRTTGTPLFY